MHAEIVVPQSSPFLDLHTLLLTYRVPDELVATITPGQVVSVPLGTRSAPGVVWTIEVEDAETGERAVTERSSSAGWPKEISAILTAEPLLLPTHLALAGWIANFYAAPLSSAVKLFLPPGLLSSSRRLLRLCEDGNTIHSAPSVTPPRHTPPGDEGVVVAMLRERGFLEREALMRILGKTRARRVIQALTERKLVTWTVELAGVQAHPRRHRYVRLTGTPEALEAWRSQARLQLDAHSALPRRRPSWQRAAKQEQQSERLLRQLAIVDLLEYSAREGEAGAEGQVGPWRVEDLQKLTQATPSAVRELVEAGLITIHEISRRRSLLPRGQNAPSEPLPLSPAQAAALHAITAGASSAERSGQVFLLHGITGSGKTEIYLQALATTLKEGKRGLVLVPEIALTPQAASRFAGRFPGKVAMLHSGLTGAERLEEWHRIRRGEVDIVLGSRSALFAPLDRLGLIIVDEEHEAAYKQDRRPTYNAREVAVQLGRLTGATVVLGSATPSIESYWLAQQGDYSLLELRERAPSGIAGERPMSLPAVKVVDLRAELRAGNTSILSEPLQRALQQTLENGEQSILFLNRRGAASSVVCRECGYVARCGYCDVSLTYHASEQILLCHYCNRQTTVPTVCPSCQSASIRHFGLGTERVQQTVQRLFPRARVLRWDRDTARSREAHEHLLRAFVERRADILVGTQMIAKGLDLPGVTLVGVVSADVALFLPDFRASERAFALLTQVAGRAGRGRRPGSVLVQTLNPDHFCIQCASRHDYAGFFAAEISARQRYGYPPFRRFVKCTFEHSDRYTAQIEATVLAERLQQLIQEYHLTGTDIVGPAPAFMERLRGRYRWQVILRSPDPSLLVGALTGNDLPIGWSIDMDPAATL